MPANQLDRSRRNGLEYWPKLRWRACDHFQNVRRGGLPFQRLPGLVEQPHVFDRNDGLAGEILQQRDLLVGERPDLLPVQIDHADDIVVLDHRDIQHRPRAAEVDAGNRVGIAAAVGLAVAGIVDVRRLPGRTHRVDRGRRAARMQMLPPIFGKRARYADFGHRPHRALLALIDETALRFAETHRLGEHLVEHRLEVAG